MASAAKGGATRLLSEDLNSGRIIAGAHIDNPFSNMRGQESSERVNGEQPS